MADQLRGGSTAGGYPIVTQKEVPMIFRVDAGKLQYSVDGGASWVDGEFTGDATATAAQILSGVTAYVGGNKITGSLSLTGSAATSQVLSGATFYSNNPASKLTGIMANRGAPTWNPSASVQSLASGYYSGGTINPSVKMATGTHSGSSGTTLTKTVGWKPRFVMIKGTRGMWFLSGDVFTSIVTSYDSAGSVIGSTAYNHYGLYLHPTSSGTAYNWTTNSITTTGFSIALPLGSTGYSYTWWAYGY